MDTPLRTHTFNQTRRLELVQGDITTQHVDAIVNAANAHLMHGGGVAAAIARKAGRALKQESRAWVRQHGPVNPAEPAYTTGGNLPCRYVIHAVGPVWHGGNQGETQALHIAVTGALRRAEELALSSLAMPAISTGIFGFPAERAATVMFEAIRAYFAAHPDTSLSLVRIVLFDRRTLQAFLQAWDAWQPA
ncbi:MAG: macro domain-containing protein [Anaerolineae bacterium]|nr:MAG: macro domain-containing protein [Anaerolineae bacterium]